MYRQSEKIVKQQYLLHMSPQHGELRPTSGWDRFVSLRHPSKFQRVHVLASLLQRHRSTNANQTLQDVWPSPGLVHYIHFWGCCPLTEFCQLQKFTLCSTLAFSNIKLCGVVQGIKLRNIRRGRHLYSAGRPSRWVSAHILVLSFFFSRLFSAVADWMSTILSDMMWP